MTNAARRHHWAGGFGVIEDARRRGYGTTPGCSPAPRSTALAFSSRAAAPFPTHPAERSAVTSTASISRTARAALINAGMVTATGTLNGVAFSTTFGGPGNGLCAAARLDRRQQGWHRDQGRSRQRQQIPGAIEGATGHGVRSRALGGNIVNAAGGIIRAANGDIVYIDGAGSVTNAGTIAQIGSALNRGLFPAGLREPAHRRSRRGVRRHGQRRQLDRRDRRFSAGTGCGRGHSHRHYQFRLRSGIRHRSCLENFRCGHGARGRRADQRVPSPGDTIELAGVTASKTALVGDTLQLTGGLELVLPGNTYIAYNQFQITNSGGNTDITVACFLQPARASTSPPPARVPVEELPLRRSRADAQQPARPRRLARPSPRRLPPPHAPHAMRGPSVSAPARLANVCRRAI